MGSNPATPTQQVELKAETAYNVEFMTREVVGQKRHRPRDCVADLWALQRLVMCSLAVPYLVDTDHVWVREPDANHI